MISASACQTGGGQLQIGYLRIYVDKSVQKDIVEVQGFKGSRVQRFKGSEVQGSEVQGSMSLELLTLASEFAIPASPD